MTLTILGNSAGGPFHGRHYTAHFLQVENAYFLIDCGEGTQMQMFQYRTKTERVNQIFITHLHGDHMFGLLGLITNWSLKGRTAPLQIFAPPGLEEWIETTCRICSVRLPYSIEFVVVDATVSQKVFENAVVEVWTVPLNHRTACTGWIFIEKEKPRNILKTKIDEYQIHYSLIPGIKAGGDLQLPDGQVVTNAELTTPPPRPLSYAFCSDTAPSDAVVAAVKGVDVLYHEATFTNEHVEEALISFHSTAAQAAQIAKDAEVGQLILGHFSGRYADAEQHLAEARVIFTNTFAAEEGIPIEITAHDDLKI
ncbi:MAG: ribonuclease Z [Saprospiraceae bacterium]|nr:ribonuclease Z [Saprospiraceae bacterium]